MSQDLIAGDPTEEELSAQLLGTTWQRFGRGYRIALAVAALLTLQLFALQQGSVEVRVLDTMPEPCGDALPGGSSLDSAKFDKERVEAFSAPTSEATLQVCPPEFDWIELGRVGRKKQDARPDRFDRGACLDRLVDTQVVHHHHVSTGNEGDELTAHEVDEALPVDRSLNRLQPGLRIDANRSDHGQRLPSSCRAEAPCAEASSCPASFATHAGSAGGLVKEDEPLRGNGLQRSGELSTGFEVLRRFALQRCEGLFFSEYPRRLRARTTAERLTWTPVVLSRFTANSALVLSGFPSTSRTSVSATLPRMREWLPPPRARGAMCPVSR